MKPIPREPFRPGSGATLRDLALVVGEDVVFATGMKVNLPGVFAFRRRQQPLCHRTALEVPSGISLAPRTRPSHQMRGVRLPKQEVGGVSLRRLVCGADSSALAFAKRLDGVAAQTTVVGETRHRKVDGAVATDIGVLSFNETLDQCNHFGHPSSRAGHQCGFGIRILNDFEPQQSCILYECGRVKIGNRSRITRVEFHAVRKRT